MPRYFLEITYNGTSYNGWQTQPNGLGVQQVIESNLEKILRKTAPITGSGRTDTGVHAKQQFAHVDLEDSPFSLNELLHKLNSVLPDDIAVLSIREVTPGAHARFDAVRRTYHYNLILRKDPFLNGSAWFFRGSLDMNLIQQACPVLFEFDDFSSFCKSHASSKTMTCKIFEANWKMKEDGLWVFTISADRFLRNMVRAIVGTMVEIGKGKISIDQFREIIRNKDRKAAGMSAEPQGLFLVKVEYPPHIFL